MAYPAPKNMSASFDASIQGMPNESRRIMTSQLMPLRVTVPTEESTDVLKCAEKKGPHPDTVITMHAASAGATHFRMIRVMLNSHVIYRLSMFRTRKIIHEKAALSRKKMREAALCGR